MAPLVRPLAMLAPGARLAPRSGVLPCNRNPVPALESKIEKGRPDWKMVTPLIAQLPRSARFAPVAFAKNGKL